MGNIILVTIGVLIIIFILISLWSCCVMSGRSSRRDEELELQNEIEVSFDNDNLSHLEKSAVNTILENVNEDGVAYIPANGK